MTFSRNLIVAMCLIGVCQSARLNVEDMDYNSLVSLLADYDAGVSEDAEKAINVASPGTFSQKYETTFVDDGGNEDQRKHVGSSLDFTISKPSVTNLLSPHVEVLRLAEAFLKLKGEMASRVYALINDNFDLFKSIYSLVLSKISKMHSFTLSGISVIRKILEFAVNMIATWEMKAPSFGFSFNR